MLGDRDPEIGDDGTAASAASAAPAAPAASAAADRLDGAALKSAEAADKRVLKNKNPAASKPFPVFKILVAVSAFLVGWDCSFGAHLVVTEAVQVLQALMGMHLGNLAVWGIALCVPGFFLNYILFNDHQSFKDGWKALWNKHEGADFESANDSRRGIIIASLFVFSALASILPAGFYLHAYFTEHAASWQAVLFCAAYFLSNWLLIFNTVYDKFFDKKQASQEAYAVVGDPQKMHWLPFACHVLTGFVFFHLKRRLQSLTWDDPKDYAKNTAYGVLMLLMGYAVYSVADSQLIGFSLTAGLTKASLIMLVFLTANVLAEALFNENAVAYAVDSSVATTAPADEALGDDLVEDVVLDAIATPVKKAQDPWSHRLLKNSLIFLNGLANGALGVYGFVLPFAQAGDITQISWSATHIAMFSLCFISAASVSILVMHKSVQEVNWDAQLPKDKLFWKGFALVVLPFLLEQLSLITPNALLGFEVFALIVLLGDHIAASSSAPSSDGAPSVRVSSEISGVGGGDGPAAALETQVDGLTEKQAANIKDFLSAFS